MRVRSANYGDLETLVTFTAEAARAAEGIELDSAVLKAGIGVALEDSSLARYWRLVDGDEFVGSVSALVEWSDWHAGYYWWIQSMYILPSHRGKGLMTRLPDAVKLSMREQGGLQLRLYVHEKNEVAMKAYAKAGFRSSGYRIMINED